jgi:hypothetical protein
MLMRRILSTVIVLALAAGCGIRNQTHAIADVTKSETIILKKAASQDAIHYINIVGKGTLEGAAEITLILNGKPYRTEKLSGTVDFQWSGEWYSDSATIEYKVIMSPVPERMDLYTSSVRSGSLNLQYHFK